MSTLARRRPWTGGPRLSRHLEAETRPAWSSHLYQAVLGKQQGEFPVSYVVRYLPQRLKLYFQSCFPLSLQEISASEVLGALGDIQGFPGGSDGKESTCNMGDPGLIPGLGRSPGEGTGYPLQYSCLESLMDRGT